MLIIGRQPLEIGEWIMSTVSDTDQDGEPMLAQVVGHDGGDLEQVVLADKYAYSELLQGYMQTESETAVRWPMAASWEWARAEYNEKTGVCAGATHRVFSWQPRRAVATRKIRTGYLLLSHLHSTERTATADAGAEHNAPVRSAATQAARRAAGADADSSFGPYMGAQHMEAQGTRTRVADSDRHCTMRGSKTVGTRGRGMAVRVQSVPRTHGRYGPPDDDMPSGCVRVRVGAAGTVGGAPTIQRYGSTILAVWGIKGNTRRTSRLHPERGVLRSTASDQSEGGSRRPNRQNRDDGRNAESENVGRDRPGCALRK